MQFNIAVMYEQGLGVAKSDTEAARWYRAAAEERGVALTDPEAREIVYGMPYDEWRKMHQKEATPEQKAAFAASQPKH